MLETRSKNSIKAKLSGIYSDNGTKTYNITGTGFDEKWARNLVHIDSITKGYEVDLSQCLINGRQQY